MNGGSTIVISGATFDDDTFTNDFGTWNVTKAWADCIAGKHGQPWAVDTAEAMTANAGVEVDEAKVALFMTRPDILKIPGIAVMEKGALWLIEGAHRLNARSRLKLPDFPLYVIEEQHEPGYRVLFNGRRKLPG